MTIDEKIAHEKRLAVGYRNDIQIMKNMGADISSIISLTKKAEYHEQLAEQLEELKLLKEEKKEFQIIARDNYEIGYERAIDNFTERLTTYLGVENATKYGNKDAEQQRNSYDTLMKYEIAAAIEDVAEQLKEGN